MITKSYTLDTPHVWLVIHINSDGEITAVEDHDWREGGHIIPYNNETYEQLFIQRALRRGFTQQKIDEFLTESKAQARQLNVPKSDEPITQR